MTESRLHCRICESACGLVAHVEAGRLTKLAPDPEHPVSLGYACIKGTHFGEQLQRADRHLFPSVHGSVSTWPDALAHSGNRLAAIVAESGPNAVGLYVGNAAGHSLGAILGATLLQRSIGTTRSYSCLTLDNAGQFVVLEAVFGNAMHTFCADYANSDCVVLFGTNPLASQASQAQSNPRGVPNLLRHRSLVVIDPVCTPTAKVAKLHLQPRPGGDVELLAYILSRCIAAGRCANGAAGLADVVAPFTLDRACLATNLPPAQIEALVDEILQSKHPLIWTGLGVLLSRDGTLGYWLGLCIQAALDGLDRPGGWIHSPGSVDIPRLFSLLGVKGSDPNLRSSTGHSAVLGTLNAASMPGDIEGGRLRALVVVGGNPAVSLPDTRSARSALAKLDFLVCIDPFPNATTALAHVVFPPTLWPERWDTNLHMNNQRPASADGRAPPVDESEPAIEAPGQTRDDWEILLELTRAAGALPWSLGWLGPKTPRYIARLARSLPLIHPIRITKNLLIPKFITQLARRDTRYPAVVLLTSHRNLGAMNSWIGSPAPATAHPETMSSLPFPTLSDASLPPGVVVLPFGNETANTYTTNDDLDPFTGTPVFNGVVLPPRTPPAPDGR